MFQSVLGALRLNREKPMIKHLAVFACLALPVAVFAETAQQQKMATCNKEAGAKNLAGDARKAFMSECLSAGAKPKMTQQEKMGYCNKEAGAKKLEGDARKKFMSQCLSG
jgi:hypothetical protein